MRSDALQRAIKRSAVQHSQFGVRGGAWVGASAESLQSIWILEEGAKMEDNGYLYTKSLFSFSYLFFRKLQQKRF